MPDGEAEGRTAEGRTAEGRTAEGRTAEDAAPGRSALLARARAWLGEPDPPGPAGPGGCAGGDRRPRVLALDAAAVPRAAASWAAGGAPATGGSPLSGGPEPSGGPGRGGGPEESVAVVVPGCVPLGSDELELVGSAGVPPAGLVFVVAGRRLGGSLREAVARHRAVLAEFAPGYERCPFVAGAAPPGEFAAALHAAQARLDAADAEADHAACAVAAGLARRRRGARRAQDAARREADGLRARRARAVDRRARLRAQGGAQARLTRLRTEVSRARMELSHEVGARCRASSAAVREELDGAGRAGVRAHPQRLTRRLESVGAVLAERVEDTCAQAVGESEPEGGVVEAGSSGPRMPAASAAAPPAASAAAPSVASAAAPPVARARPRATEDRLMILMGASGGLGMGRVVMSMPLASGAFDGAWAWLAWPSTLLIGGMIAWWIVRARAHLGERGRARQRANERIAEFRAAWEQYVAQRMLDAEAEAVQRVGAGHAEEVRALDRTIAELDARLAAAGRASERRARRADADLGEGREILDGLRRTCRASQ